MKAGIKAMTRSGRLLKKEHSGHSPLRWALSELDLLHTGAYMHTWSYAYIFRRSWHVFLQKAHVQLAERERDRYTCLLTTILCTCVCVPVCACVVVVQKETWCQEVPWNPKCFLVLQQRHCSRRVELGSGVSGVPLFLSFQTLYSPHHGGGRWSR